MVVFKVDPTKIVIPVMHFGESKETILTFDRVIWSFSALKRSMYLYRIGAVLRMLGCYKLIDEKALRGFLLTCQSEVMLPLPLPNRSRLSAHT
jgi:hypothetical protein